MNKRLSELLVNQWVGVNCPWLWYKMLWMSCMSRSILHGLDVLEVIILIPVNMDEWLSKLLMNQWIGINGSWLWNEVFWVSCMGGSILHCLDVLEVIILISINMNQWLSELLVNKRICVNSPWLWNKMLWMGCMS